MKDLLQLLHRSEDAVLPDCVLQSTGVECLAREYRSCSEFVNPIEGILRFIIVEQVRLVLWQQTMLEFGGRRKESSAHSKCSG